MEFKSKFIPLYKLLQLLLKTNTDKVLKFIMNSLNNNNSIKVKIAIITENL